MKRLKKILRITLCTLLSLVLLLIIISTINNRIGNCKVEGNIKGLGTTIALVTGGSNSYKKNFFKLILVWNGKFSFNANLGEPGGGRIISRNMFFKRASGQSLWMRSKIIDFSINPNEHISIEGEMNQYSINYAVKGNILSEQASQFRKQNISILERETQTRLLLDKLTYEDASKQIIDTTNAEFDKIRESYNNKRLEYAKANPSYEIAATYLQSQNKDSILKYFPLLTEKVKMTEQGKLLQERIKAWTQVEVGKPVPAFSSTTIDGKTFNLPDLKGKFIVLDFWGSWCGPCVSGFPKMKEYYNKYRNKFEFVGIACRDNEADWKKAVQKYGLQWTQILNNEKYNLNTKYSVEGYPTKILIDKEGNLVQIFNGESVEFYQKLDELFGK